MNEQDKLLELIRSNDTPAPDALKKLIVALDNHQILAKVFLLEGIPFVFKDSPMKYIIFKEQVADRFDTGSQDVCIVGSAKLGYSPSPYKYGKPFSETSDVDVVIISESLFYKGSKELFAYLNAVEDAGSILTDITEAMRNFTFDNFNPANLPHYHHLRNDIFEKISSTAGLFLALEPQVFVSKIRSRIFKNWKAAEGYYANTLRQAKYEFKRDQKQPLEAPEYINIDHKDYMSSVSASEPQPSP